MKKILLFILPILIIVAIALTVFGIFQVRFEEEKLLDDLKRKAIAVAESMELSIKQVLLNADTKNANYLSSVHNSIDIRLLKCLNFNWL